MDLYNNKDMEKFIVDVFNYFNGRVNTFQKARLFINWCNMMNTPNGGVTTNPNCVTIYPNVIRRYSDSQINISIAVIQTIIHELYHIDQCIIYDKLIIDYDYLNMIENAVEINSVSYIYNHQNEINKIFGINMNISSDYITKYMYNYIGNNIYYHRQKYIDHLLSVFESITNMQIYNEQKDTIISFMNNPKTKIILCINGEEITIKEKNSLQDVNILNDWLYDNYFSRNIRSNIDIKYYNKFDILRYDIKCNLYNIVANQI